MKAMILHSSKTQLSYIRVLCNVHKILQNYVPKTPCTTNIDAINAFTSEIIQKHKRKLQDSNDIFANNEFLNKSKHKTTVCVESISTEELDNIFFDLLSKKKDKKITEIIYQCLDRRKMISEIVLMKLLRKYSQQGQTNMVDIVCSYYEEVYQETFSRNGNFVHYVAKAECMKGNSKKGLTILKDAYNKFESLRCLYRIIFRDLIHDTVLNRSEASIVIFKNTVLEFSEEYSDHYPMVCMWHICWLSSWFSNQLLSNELFDTSKVLRNIVKDKAMTFSSASLHNEQNDDATIRLLQLLLKYEFMTEYIKVIYVLFNYKLMCRDVRGCTEIIKNCQSLGVELPLHQQGRYIKMLINGHQPPQDRIFKSFKLKF